jgi:valyl-tRNA synthetase
VLTIGHMLGDTVMDVLARRARMRGLATLWVPAIDHAGLATQVEVRRRLARQGVRFEELGREEALRAIGTWKEEHERRIVEQTRAAGFSVDWSRYRYTMDAGSTRATREAFVALYRAGLVYRGERLVNWDPRLRTAISDLEVVHAEEDGELVIARYRWADGSPGGLDVATVRPETIFGDVGVAVHPDDERYRADIGRRVRVPLVDREVLVVADPAVDPAFGAGALKVTPRHDPVDREVALRHPELPPAQEIFDESARLTGPWVPEEFRGLDREAARARTTEALQRAGLLVRREPYRHSVARSERSEAVIEPRLSMQWFVRMRTLAEPVVEGVRRREIRLHPERWSRTFFRWMEEIQDWCISRQIVWGHPVPVDYCVACGEAVVTLEPPTECPKCHGRELRPDPDVLDTWFTSWLWPFAALGWPERTGDLERYYPTSVLVTGRDIMFFWVARMMIAGYRFTGGPPFSDVYFTGMLRDDQGRRMSKHLGNSPDPLAVVGERGADTMRFALLFPNPTDEDGPFGAATLDGARNFLTKLWNLTRFALLQLPPGTPAPTGPPPLSSASALADRWVLERYRATAVDVDEAIASFAPTRAASALHAFLWHDVADRYVEISREALSGRLGEPRRREAVATLAFVLERSLRLLHPIAPHVTEELWHALPHEGELLLQARWPEPAEVSADPEAVAEMAPVLETVRLLRNLRSEEGVAADASPRGFVRPARQEVRAVLSAHHGTVARLAHLAFLTVLDPGSGAPPGSPSRVAEFGECYLERTAVGPARSEALERERARLRELLAKARARLGDPGFLRAAPPEVVQEQRKKEAELAGRLEKIDRHLEEASP